MEHLFPCLPDNIGKECLLRVKLNSHHKLRRVCKNWNALLNSPWFYQERKRLKISEQRICFVEDMHYFEGIVTVYDPADNTYTSLPPIPSTFEVGNSIIDHCSFAKQKLVLIIGVFTNMDNTMRRNYLWVYDFSCAKWREGAKMPFYQFSFTSAVDEDGGLIYVAGFYRYDDTLYRPDDPIRTAAVYNVQEDKWEPLPKMNSVMFYSEGAYAQGKFYMLTDAPFIHIFDSYTRSWKTMENRFIELDWVVSAFGRLYGFDDRGLFEYDCSQDKVNILAPLPSEKWLLYTNWATVVGHNIFVKTWNGIRGRILYKFGLSSETEEAFKWICIESSTPCHRTDSGVATTIHL